MSLRIVQAKKTSLRTPLAAADTSVKLRELVDIDDNELALSDFGEFFVLVVKQGSTIEIIKCDGLTQVGDGTANATVATNGRSIAPTYPYAGAATGEDFQTAEVIVTNDPLTMSRFASLDNANTWDETQTFTVSPVVPTPTSGELTAPASVEYANNLAIAGAPDGAENVKGIYEAATQTEVDEGDDVGTTTAPTVARPSKVANAVQRGVWVAFTETASGDDAYTATTTPSFTPANKSMVFGSFATANTGGATFALNGETPVAIQKVVSGALGALETGDIIANAPLFLYRTASVWVLLSPGGTMPTTALLSEMATFFGTFDGSAANATKVGNLIDGSTITDKHFHKKTYGAAVPNGTTSQVIAHGLSATPKRIRIHCAGSTNSGVQAVSHGEYDGSTYACAASGQNSSVLYNRASTDKIVDCQSSGTAVTATVVIDGTNITITWSTATNANMAFLWEAEV